MIRYEENPKLGFYQVGQSRHYNKIVAMEEATRLNEFPRWIFNDEVFAGADWLHEPETDLRSLYRIRAQQIREKYDYIRLELSGGGDSTTVAYSFINNGIYLDEVVFRYPKTGERHLADDPFNTKPENTLSEYRFAAKPILDWVARHSPGTKITLHDYSEDMLEKKHDESVIYRSREHLMPNQPFKHAVAALDSHRRTLDQGQRVCVLWGIDKPKICIQDQRWYVYFMDVQANGVTPYIDDWTNITNEYFFWTPDLPELLVKQAHIIRRWFDMPCNQHLQHFVRWPNYSFAQRTAYEQLIKPLIYPDYDATTFQTSKPTNSFYNEMDHWFYVNFRDTHAYRVWQAGIKHAERNIDSKYFNFEFGRAVGLVGFMSPFYCMGDAVFQDPGTNVHHRF